MLELISATSSSRSLWGVLPPVLWAGWALPSCCTVVLQLLFMPSSAGFSSLPYPPSPLSLSLPTLLPPFDEAYFPVQYPHRSHWGVYLENVVLPWKTTLFTAHPFLILLLWGLCASHCLGATLPLCKLWITNSNAKVILIYRYANNSPCPSPNPIQKGSFIFVNWFAYN